MHRINIHFMIFLIIILCCTSCDTKQLTKDHDVSVNTESQNNRLPIKMILGSTRKGRSSEKIAAALQKMANKRTDVSIEIIDLRDYPLPFLNDEVSPKSRKGSITDPAVKKWSEKIADSPAFIIIVPEYNAGYPGVLKNALDSLYKEWNNKPVAFVGFSGGSSGGTKAVAQLRQVVDELQMIPVDIAIHIPAAWKALDKDGNLVDQTIDSTLNMMLDQLITAHNNSSKDS
jgi:NAD(P)H-dependent FMN reductase